MVNLRKNRKTFLSAHDMGNLLCCMTWIGLPTLTFFIWDYERFDLDRMNDDEWIAEFRFNLVISL